MFSKYFGWIPTISGRLSFSSSGQESYPNRIFNASSFHDGGRFFAGFQKRNLSDTTLPFFESSLLISLFDHYILHKSGDFHFVCLMKISEDEKFIQGKMYMCPTYEFKKRRKDLKSAIYESVYTTGETDRLHDSLYSKFSSSVVSICKFRVLRNGVCELELESIDEDFFEKILKNKKDAAQSALCSQFYFFLKDIFHSHKFHSPSTDAILDVYLKRSEMHARVNFALVRKAVYLRRQKRVHALYNAIGVINYLKAFRENVMSKSGRDKIPYSLDHFEKSCETMVPILERNERYSFRNRIERYSGIGLTAITTLFAYFTVVKDPTIGINKSGSFISIFSEYFDRYYTQILILGLAFLVLQFAVANEIKPRDKLIRNYAKFAITIPKKKSVPLVLLMSCIAFSIGVGFLYWRGFIF